ncbi:hypothetical protein ACIOD2_06345 [Amycolatopsis sp. NPDC088138]|uniref:hypothetical protein n=1 Tax=Amycolatopsis sp. NPDC088138 TaxID=3363938 RepID=UPI003828B4BC
MRDKRNDLRPVADLLLDAGDPADQERTRRKAALAVAAGAKDADDCALLLEMLGLHRDAGGKSAGKSTEVA